MPRSPPTGRPSADPTLRRFLQRVADRQTVPVEVDPDGVGERAQVEGVEVHHPAQLGVGGVQHLEATVEGEAVHVVGAHPSADGVTGLQHHHVDAPGRQLAGAGQAGQPGADDDHLVRAHGRSRWAWRNSGGR